MSKIVNLTTPLVSVDWLHTHRNDSRLILLDATINKEIDRNSTRIPKARFFDIKKKFSDTAAPFPSPLPSKEQFQKEARALGINKDSVIVVYDDKGIYSSARAWWMFKTFGFNAVAVLDDGLPEWKNQNFEIENYKNESYALGDIEAEYQPNLMTDFDGVKALSCNSKTLIIDARSEERFKCLVDEPRSGLRRGIIPGSKNLPYTDLFDGNKLKSIAELSEIFNNLVLDSTTVVFSCGSGITACILALGATLCDYENLIVYDGSWTEYGSLTNN